MENKKPRIIRSEKEINEVLEQALEQNEHSPDPLLTYHDGVVDMYDWLTGALKELRG
jgi:Asp-tRNA(Asn)/Glu-tRNA(Gln) amidotransferase B subunit